MSRNIIFKNECGIQNYNNNDDFCYSLLKQKNFIGLAHNLKAYDGFFIKKNKVDNPLPTHNSPQIIDQMIRIILYPRLYQKFLQLLVSLKCKEDFFRTNLILLEFKKKF